LLVRECFIFDTTNGTVGEHARGYDHGGNAGSIPPFTHEEARECHGQGGPGERGATQERAMNAVDVKRGRSSREEVREPADVDQRDL
jgi:hypothetical protein